MEVTGKPPAKMCDLDQLDHDLTKTGLCFDR